MVLVRKLLAQRAQALEESLVLVGDFGLAGQLASTVAAFGAQGAKGPARTCGPQILVGGGAKAHGAATAPGRAIAFP